MIYTRKKNPKKIRFFLLKKVKFLHKKKNFLAKIVKKPAKFFMGPQMFSGDELALEAAGKKKASYFTP